MTRNPPARILSALTAFAALALAVTAGLGSTASHATAATAADAVQAAPILDAHADSLFDPALRGLVPTADAVRAPPTLAASTSVSVFACATHMDQARFQLVIAQPRLSLLDAADSQSGLATAGTATLGVGTSLGPLWLASFEAAASVLVRDGAARGEALRFRMECANAVPSVLVVEVPDRGLVSGSRAIADVAAALGAVPGSGNTDYMVLYNGAADAACRCSGIGQFWHDDRLSAANMANAGGLVGITFLGAFAQEDYGYLYLTLLHESFHNLGAVQGSAPNASGKGHCNDGLDVMCYSDGGPTSAYRDHVCPTGMVYGVGSPFNYGFEQVPQLDCNGDDYFHPHPPAGNYLCSRWNVASRLDRFLHFDLPQVALPGTCY